jgi:hypothetical protein
MPIEQPWYVAERGESLATVLLTRVSGVRVEKADRTLGLDLVVLVQLAGRSSTSRFGVEVKSTLRSKEWVRLDGSIPKKMLNPVLKNADRFLLPIALMIMNVRSQDAWFTWIKSPHPTTGKLRNCTTPRATLVGEQTLSTAIDEFRSWSTDFSTQWTFEVR